MFLFFTQVKVVYKSDIESITEAEVHGIKVDSDEKMPYVWYTVIYCITGYANALMCKFVFYC